MKIAFMSSARGIVILQNYVFISKTWDRISMYEVMPNEFLDRPITSNVQCYLRYVKNAILWGTVFVRPRLGFALDYAHYFVINVL